jgi:hypothetical protein
MDIIGTGDTDEAAARCGQRTVFGRGAGVQRIYNGETEPLDGSGAPTAAAVLFTRQQVNRYISEVVVGWRRRKALEAAEAAVSSDGVVMQ